jgi:tetratricopeptide (TPR) repeat protein
VLCFNAAFPLFGKSYLSIKRRRYQMKSYVHSALIVGMIALFILVSQGCAPSVKVPVTRPAEINLAGVKRIAVGQIDGNVGNELSDMLTQELFNSGRYEVLDRQYTNRIMAEHSLNLSGAVNESTAARVGQLLGASALIVGNSNARYELTKDKSEGYRDKEGRLIIQHHKAGHAVVDTTLQVLDLATGRVLAVKRFTEEEWDETWENNKWPPDPDRDLIIGQALAATSGRFMKIIAPYTEYVHVKFENSDIAESKTGIEFAKAGQWNEARRHFRLAVEQAPNDAAAWYNLGLAYQYTAMFDEAVSAFNKSNGLKPANKCIEQIVNCNKLKAESVKLERQLGDSGNR